MHSEGLDFNQSPPFLITSVSLLHCESNTFFIFLNCDNPNDWEGNKISFPTTGVYPYENDVSTYLAQELIASKKLVCYTF